MSIVVEGTDIGKRYRINLQQNGRYRYRSFREELTSFVARPFRAIREGAALGHTEAFWALRELDFTVQAGDTVGVIGRNGAGKSTLLKILSRITQPTTGRVRMLGRVGSLLEVGTGFHPELTGRENVYLNGAILGMSRREIRSKFDAIVGFSGIEQFLDTPIKRYSSGMHVRLAFSVAAHLDPEIMIVDEVLAVGDAEFQRRCLGKMNEVAKSGRTVIFVSHDMDAVANLTERCIWLDGGMKREEGDTAEIIRNYLRQYSQYQSQWTDAAGNESRSKLAARFTRIAVLGPEGQPQSVFSGGEPITLVADYEVREPVALQVAFRLVSMENGKAVLTSGANDHQRVKVCPVAPGCHRSQCVLPAPFLPPGQYTVLFALNGSGKTHFDILDSVVSFEVASVASLTCLDGRVGAVLPLLEWQSASLAPLEPACAG